MPEFNKQVQQALNELYGNIPHFRLEPDAMYLGQQSPEGIGVKQIQGKVPIGTAVHELTHWEQPLNTQGMMQRMNPILQSRYSGAELPQLREIDALMNEVALMENLKGRNLPLSQEQANIAKESFILKGAVPSNFDFKNQIPKSIVSKVTNLINKFPDAFISILGPSLNVLSLTNSYIDAKKQLKREPSVFELGIENLYPGILSQAYQPEL